MNDGEQLRLKLRLFLQECVSAVVCAERKEQAERANGDQNARLRRWRAMVADGDERFSSLNNRFWLSGKGPGERQKNRGIRLDYLWPFATDSSVEK